MDDLVWSQPGLVPHLADGRSPDTKAEGTGVCVGSLRTTRIIDPESPQDALYVEKISRLLPTQHQFAGR